MKKLFYCSCVLCGIMLSMACSKDETIQDNTRKGVEYVTDSCTHEYVDLGLPSGTLWATTNVGADSAYQCGDYFAWGETEPKSNYADETYCFTSENGDYWKGEYTKYNYVDGKLVLDSIDDVANKRWKQSWRMPTKENVAEIDSMCVWTDTIVHSVNCVKITSKINGNYIIMPYAGFCFGMSNRGYGKELMYWTSSIKLSSNNCLAYQMSNRNVDNDLMSLHGFNSSKLSSFYGRRVGMPIRPVRKR